MNIPEPAMGKEKDKDEPVEKRDGSSWAEDQGFREYYYDDAHGYEVFDPREDEESTEEIKRDDS